MARSSLNRELMLAGGLLTVAAVVLLVVLLGMLGSDVDPADIAPAEVEVRTVERADEAPPLPDPEPAARPAARTPSPPPAVSTTLPIPERPPVGDDGPSDHLRGKVQSESGSPIAGASVSVKKGRRAVADGMTDGDGSFSVGPIEPGRFRLVVSATGYASSELSRSGVPSAPLTIVLREGGHVAGRVVDDWSGEPLARAAVRVGLQKESAVKGRRSVDQSTRTDEQGNFKVEGLQSGSYTVAASHSGYAVSAQEAVEVGAGASAEGLVLRLAKESVVEGRVVDDSTNEPIAKALAVFRPPFPAGPRRARTRRDGTFVLKGITPGRASIEVSRTGYLTKWVSGLDVSPGETQSDIEVRLQKPGSSLDDLDAPPGVQRAANQSGLRHGFQYAGIGAVIRRPADGGPGVVVQKLMAGGAAEAAGLGVGTRILEVDGEPVTAESLARAVELLRGSEGEPVTIKVQDTDGGERLVQPVRRMMTMPRGPRG